jgi:hypothetical protein
MSGGSYDYLYGANPSLDFKFDMLDQMISDLKKYLDDPEFDRLKLNSMTDKLAKLEQDKQHLFDALKLFETTLDELSDIFKAQEMYTSCDWGKDSVIKAVSEL